MGFEARMFPDRRADLYIGSVVAWWILLIGGDARTGWTGHVTDAVGGLMLTGELAAAAAIAGIAFLITRDVDGDGFGREPVRILVLFWLRWVVLTLGFGIPAAIRSLRRAA